MGCSDSSSGVQGEMPLKDRKCICLMCPPLFEAGAFVASKPKSLDYRYISIGKLIRDEINKKSQYSEALARNLEKSGKINEEILQILLKYLAAQGNIIIQFSPKVPEDLFIWRKFIRLLKVDLIAVILPESKAARSQKTSLLNESRSKYYEDIEHIKEMFPGESIREYENNGQIWVNIMRYMTYRQKDAQEDQSE